MSDDKNIAKFSKFTVVYYFSEFGMPVFKIVFYITLKTPDHKYIFGSQEYRICAPSAKYSI